MIRLLLPSLVCLFSLVVNHAFASPIPAEKLFLEQHVALPSISPDGKYVSFITRIDDTDYLALQDTRTLALQGIVIIEENQKLLNYNWLDANTILLSVKRGSRTRLVIAYRDTSSKEPKWDNLMLKYDGYLVGSLEEDPENVLLAIHSQQENVNLELYRLPIDDLKIGKVFTKYLVEDPELGFRFYAYDEELKRLIIMRLDFPNEAINLETRSLKNNQILATYKIYGADMEFMPIGFLSESKMAVLSNKDSDTRSLYEFDLVTNKFGKLLYKHDKYDLVDASVSSVSGKVLSVNYFDHGRLTTEYFSAREKNLNALLKSEFGDKQFTVAANNPNTNHKVLFAFASNDSGSYYLFDDTSDSMTKLLPLYPDLENTELAQNSNFKVKSSDGTEIEAYLTLPLHNNNHTLLVMPHGGPIGIREYDSFNPLAQYFASRGFSVLRINFRGSSGFGSEFEKAGVGQFGQLIEQDISDVVEQVRAQYTFKNLCAMGSSYGGYSSMMLAIKHPDLYSCVVGSFGIYDLPLLFNSSNIDSIDEIRQSIENVVGKESDSLYEVSPVYYAQEVKAPVLLFAGLNDDVAPAEHTRRMEYVLNKHDSNVQAIYYKKTGHGHNSWLGDWHQLALTYQFLVDSLGLPKLQKSDIKAQDLAEIQREFLRVASFYASGKSIVRNQELAFKFFQLGSDLDDAEATYRLARYYEVGSIVDKNIDKALDIYRAASALGSEHAAYKLADVNYKGEWVTRDLEKALSFYELAKQREYNSAAGIKIARAYCLGEGVSVDIPKCLSILNIEELRKDKNNKNEVNDYSYATLRRVLAQIFMSEKLSSDVRRELIAQTRAWYDIQSVSSEVEIDDYGVVSKGRYKNKYDGEQQISLSENERFGVRLDVDIDANPDKKLPRGIYIINWQIEHTDGKKTFLENTLIWGNKKRNWETHLYNRDMPKDADTVTLQIKDLNNNILVQQPFTIIE